jgi:hypothetical protein
MYHVRKLRTEKVVHTMPAGIIYFQFSSGASITFAEPLETPMQWPLHLLNEDASPPYSSGLRGSHNLSFKKGHGGPLLKWKDKSSCDL